MDFNKLKQINSTNQDKASSQVLETKRELANLQSQETFVKAIQSLAKFMEGHTSKTIVMNQLKGYATGEDVDKLDNSLTKLYEQLQTHKNVDIQPLVQSMEDAVKQLEQLPKNHKDIEFPDQKDYTQQFESLVTATTEVMDAVKAQQTTVEAPVVNVESPTVQVEAPDLKPLGKELKKSFETAVKKIVIPKFDVSKVVAEQKKTTKAIDKLHGLMEELPMGGGSTGGGIGPFMQNGALPVTGTINATPSTLADFSANDLDTTNGYYGLTKPDATWLVLYKTDTSVSYATVTNNVSVTSYTDAWTDKETLTYGRFDEAF